MMITKDDAISELKYNLETGEFFRLKGGTKTGSKNSAGYLTVSIKRKNYYAHRIAWLICNNKMPKIIDHINCDKSDNRISNLRIATKSQNGSNRSSAYSSTGFRGVYFQSNTNKYRVRIKNIHFGYFDNINDAVSEANIAMKKLYGDFSGAQQIAL